MLKSLTAMALDDARFFHFFDSDSVAINGFDVFEQFDVGIWLKRDFVK